MAIDGRISLAKGKKDESAYCWARNLGSFKNALACAGALQDSRQIAAIPCMTNEPALVF